MARGKNSEVTGKKAASNAANTLGDPNASKAAGSALTQAPNKRKK